MRIEKEEIKKIADSIMIEFSKEEIDELVVSINNITSKLDDLLKVEVDENEEEYIHATENKNVFNSNFSEENDFSHLLEKMNNFDGEYIRIKKVVSDEE